MALSKETKLYIQLGLSGGLFFTELIVGYWVKSIALIADAFHMLNDVVSLVIAVYAVKLAQDTNYNPKYSYGLQRAEVLGALINAVLLLGLCLTIVAEAVPRFFEPVEIHNPELILVVGTVGLVFNVVGMFIFGHHHGHGHDHDHDHGHSHSQPESIIDSESLRSPAHFQQSIIETARVVSESQQTDETSKLLTVKPNHYGHSEHDLTHAEPHDHHSHSHGSGSEGHLNMQGIYLHVLGDALASLAVIASALVIWKGTFPQRFLFDPLISIVITLLIVKFTVPLIKSASIILLQGVPSSVPLDTVRTEVSQVEGVVSVHDLHVWQLSDTKSVASVHVVIDSPHHNRFKAIGYAIQKIFHTYGVHSATIQPEFENDSSPNTPAEFANLPGDNSQCLLTCPQQCAPAQCCPPKQ